MKINQTKILLYCAILLFFLPSKAQEIKTDSLRHTANINQNINGSIITLSPEMSQLRQIAGAPKAFWGNYWEFGDGNYSFKDKPKHQYKEAGNYNITLSATNNYDDGKPPTTRPKKITINSTNIDANFQNEEQNLIASHNGFRIQNNREPSPEEEMQLIISYSNDKNYTTNGKLYLFFNEKKYKAKNFDLLDIRSYHDEEEVEDGFVSLLNKIQSKDKFIRSTGIETIIDKNRILHDTIRQDLLKSIEESKNYYYDYKVWNVNDIKENEERNMFFTLKTTPEMLKDTSAVITIRSIYIPERGKNLHKITEQEMEIVTSHDPNKMAVYQTFLNYRLVRFKRLKYKVRFQNNGEGPARLIKLNVDIPKMLDKSTLKVIDMYPKVPICPDGKEVRYSCLDTIVLKDKISFQFKNIYLPGTNQKGVKEKDSTKGFVKYSMKFGKDFHKVKSKSRTEIIFDKNDPIITNSSTSRFKPGVSIGVKAGYNYYFDSDENLDFNEIKSNTTINTEAQGFFIGATISPYKSYKWYLQSEIMASCQYIKSDSFIEEERDDFLFSTINQTAINSEIQKNYLDIVPVSIRYNLNSIIGLGFGPQIAINGWQKSTVNTNTRVFFNHNGVPEEELTDLNSQSSSVTYKKGLELNNYGLFADITIGIARIGPSVGIRYVQNFNEPTKQIQTYAIWKF